MFSLKVKHTEKAQAGWSELSKSQSLESRASHKLPDIDFFEAVQVPESRNLFTAQRLKVSKFDVLRSLDYLRRMHLVICK